jgi:hypothetical protein
MGNYVIRVGNYVSASPSNLGNYVSADSRVGSGRRTTFADGEQLLSAWMSQNAFVSWVIRERPWELEQDLLGAVDLPLNLDGNIGHRFRPELTQARARCVAQANALPIVPSTGRGGR